MHPTFSHNQAHDTHTTRVEFTDDRVADTPPPENTENGGSADGVASTDPPSVNTASDNDSTYLGRLAESNTALVRHEKTDSRGPEFLNPSDVTPFTPTRKVDPKLMAAVNQQRGRGGEKRRSGITFHLDTIHMKGENGERITA